MKLQILNDESFLIIISGAHRNRNSLSLEVTPTSCPLPLSCSTERKSSPSEEKLRSGGGQGTMMSSRPDVDLMENSGSSASSLGLVDSKTMKGVASFMQTSFESYKAGESREEEEEDVSRVSIRIDEDDMAELDAEMEQLLTAQDPSPEASFGSAAAASRSLRSSEHSFRTAPSAGFERMSTDSARLPETRRSRASKSSSTNTDDGKEKSPVGSIWQEVEEPLATANAGTFPWTDDQLPMERFSEEFVQRNDEELKQFLEEEQEENMSKYKFIQEDEMKEPESEERSGWTLNGSRQLLPRPSWMDSTKSDISPSTLFLAKSENVGSLGAQAERPDWGTNPKSPESRSNRIAANKSVERNGNNWSAAESVLDEIGSSDEEEERETRKLCGPVASTPVSKQTPSPMEGLSCLSMVNPNHNWTPVSLSLPNTLSSTAINRCIADVSVGANATALADVILRVRKDLTSSAPAHATSSQREVTGNSKLTSGILTEQNQARQTRSSGLVAEEDVFSDVKMKKESSKLESGSERWSQLSVGRQGKLKCNKPRLLFGYLEVGQKLGQTAVLKNCSEEILRVTLSLQRPREGFQLMEQTGSSESAVLLCPGETHCLSVSFCPPSLGSFLNKILLTTSNSSETFSIPLLGFGGTARIGVYGCDAHSSGLYQLWVPAEKKNWLKDVIIRNSGTRTGFAKIIPFKNKKCMEVCDSSVSVEPSFVVIEAGKSVRCRISVRGGVSGVPGEEESATVAVFWAEELQRMRVRKLEQDRGRPLLATEGFRITEDESKKQENAPNNGADMALLGSADCRLLVGSLRRSLVCLISSPCLDVTNASRTFVSLCPDDGLSPVCPSVEKEEKPAKHQKERKVTATPKEVRFVATKVGAVDSVKVEFRNESKDATHLRLRVLTGPFSLKCSDYRLEKMKYVRLAVYFEPKELGDHNGELQIAPGDEDPFYIPLMGRAI